jgi:hypothetical protein
MWVEEEYITVSPSGVSVSWDAGTQHDGITSRGAGLRKVEKADGWQCLMVSEIRAPGRCVGCSVDKDKDFEVAALGCLEW